MIDHAIKVATRTVVESARYFLPGWLELAPLFEEEATPPAPPTVLPAVVGANNVVPFQPAQRQATSDLRVQQALEAGRRIQALADAQRNQEPS